MSIRSSLFPPNALRTAARIATALSTLAVFSACATDQTEPTGLNARLDAARNGAPFTEEGLASPAWQRAARDWLVEAIDPDLA